MMMSDMLDSANVIDNSAFAKRFLADHKGDKYKRYLNALRVKPGLTRLNRQNRSFMVPISREMQSRQETADVLQNSLTNFPSIYPEGLPALQLALGEIYEQKYWTGSYDRNNNKLTVEDYIKVERKPQFAYWQDMFEAKKAVNFNITQDNIDEGESDLAGQQAVYDTSAYNMNFEMIKQPVRLFARKLIKNDIQMKAAQNYNIDYETEMMDSFVAEFATKKVYRMLAGSAVRKGLIRLGSSMITLGTQQAQNMLGGFTGTTLNADISADDLTKIANGINGIVRSLSTNDLSWEEPIMVVSNVVYNKLCKQKSLSIDGHTVIMGDDGLQLLTKGATTIKILPLRFCNANNNMNPVAKDIFIIYDKAYVKSADITDLEMYGNTWETADGMNFGCYFTAQYVRPYLIDDSRFITFVEA